MPDGVRKRTIIAAYIETFVSLIKKTEYTAHN